MLMIWCPLSINPRDAMPLFMLSVQCSLGLPLFLLPSNFALMHFMERDQQINDQAVFARHQNMLYIDSCPFLNQYFMLVAQKLKTSCNCCYGVTADSTTRLVYNNRVINSLDDILRNSRLEQHQILQDPPTIPMSIPRGINFLQISAFFLT